MRQVDVPITLSIVDDHSKHQRRDVIDTPLPLGWYELVATLADAQAFVNSL